MAVALCILATSELLNGGGEAHLPLVFVGFALFNVFMNAGPNATTYALPAAVFPAEIRAAGHGFAAASAKFGAALGVFLFPILLDDVGSSALLFGGRRLLPGGARRHGPAADRAQGADARGPGGR